jgi:hypothetical protein
MNRIIFSVLTFAAFVTSASAETPGRFYGSIAYNLQTGGLGIAWNFNEQWKANDFALNKCGWGACKVYVTHYNSCSVLVVDRAKNITGFATLPDTKHEEAWQRATYECRRRGGTECRRIAWACSGPRSGRGAAM